MKLLNLILLIFAFFATLGIALPKKGAKGLFNIVKFENIPCSSNNGLNGTCYTDKECKENFGQPRGDCANGYGVCCVFTGSCGTKFSENNTYFESTGNEKGLCSMKICKLDKKIVQLRLDLNTFEIAQPISDATVVTKIINGKTAKNGKEVAAASQCAEDIFAISVPGGNAPSPICGQNSNEHMYVDFGATNCVDLNFLIGTSSTNRQWNIKVIQYRYGFSNLAPVGCTQYYYGSESQEVRTFNFAGNQHLANQNQNICVRTERGMCKICWTTKDTPKDFAVSADTDKIENKGSVCCGYGEDGQKTTGYDCVIIPGAKTKDNSAQVGSQICGRGKGIADNSGETSICSTRIPFSMRFISDNYEFKNEADASDNKGFQLTYIQSSEKC